ncbi:thioesterase domain-containing protein [Sneathiella marina]|uniref:thioesterase domain-containing protein n=1 Tax=Sneathiella marina TaxID=2950108 RepID=UPI003B845846
MDRQSNNSSTVFTMSKCATGGSLVFFPDFGGNVLYAKPIVQKLSNDVNCYGIRLKPDMIENLENLSLIDAAARFARDIAEANLPEPINVCGFSFAGYFAFETAHWLSKSHAIFCRLFILDTTIRSKNIQSRLLQSPLQELLYAIRYLGSNWRRLISRNIDPMMLHKYGQIGFDLNRHPESYRHIIRQMYKMMSTYNPREWKTGSAIVLKAGQNNKIWRYGNGDLGWDKFIHGSVTTHNVPGDHLSMLRDPDCASVLANILGNLIGAKRKGVENAQFN